MRQANTLNRLRPVTETIRKLGTARPLISASLLASHAHVADFSSEYSDLKFSWDNTFRSSAAARVRAPMPLLESNPSGDRVELLVGGERVGALVAVDEACRHSLQAAVAG